MKDSLQKVIQSIAPLNQELAKKARHRLDYLAKPRGSLGRFEDIATQIFCIQEGQKPCVDPTRIYTVAADHGVIESGVSVSPQVITRQMVGAFLQNGGGINALTNSYNIDLKVVDAGCVGGPFEDCPFMLQRKLAQGTANLAKGPAMSEELCLKALQLGFALAEEAHADGIKTLGTGEMGVGNTTPSTALFSAFFQLDPAYLAGPGGGLDSEGIQHKVSVIREALRVNASAIESGDPLRILAALGGIELATLTGLILRAASLRMLVVVDGYISSAAYAAAWKLQPLVHDYCVLSHVSAEPGHARVVDAMDAAPLLNLGFRLGEGTGAAVAIPLLRGAVDAFNNMLSFENAGVIVAEDL
ncbi:nicotinate-nucleotide--dimethylbenzimidazole phosphoribosyltransferase [Desulfobaculum bizertense]|uniref:Nicotinate-nucleotide--dimethylbenzimidazole phosphoribosyltransferase n=1 Tax=Desulfobaculum bizertense DSM 18034 TaxID=1121442 RepID=A0A1T4WIR8_9BACT|nr:nicotinate-nucleotide--dimethylbenzimidazole phosphoribosyltransferase [Desulfobaculum bizertense]SKA77202.1 nicotinate-nucleotide-dimethylbenzimidazole phosphoribosyltransferase [Desulfobaculum bizertense DSM 18034]